MKIVLKCKYLIIFFCFITGAYTTNKGNYKNPQVENYHSVNRFISISDKLEVVPYLSEENKIQENGKNTLITTVVFIFLLINIMWLYIYYNREKQKILAQEQCHLRQLTKNSIEIQENERKRIAADIHDGLIGELRYIQLVSQETTQIKRIKQCIEMARNISHDLSPPLIDKISLSELIQNYLNPYTKLYTIDIKIVEVVSTPMNTNVKLNIYRIFQEVITNIKKHANCNRISVYLKIYKGIVQLLVNDDGVGIKSEKPYGLGLKNIEIRVNQLNAKYKFINDRPRGTKFIFVCDLT